MRRKSDQDIIAETISVPQEQEPEKQSPFYKSEHNVAPKEYVSPRERDLTPEEERVRAVSYALKVAHPTAVRHAAREMAKLIEDGSVLVPVPSSSGDTSANLALAQEIARHKRVHIAEVLRRTKAVTPSHKLRRLGKNVPADHHQFELSPEHASLVSRSKVVMVDNVITSGATMAAGRKVIGGHAKGIAFAKARE